MAATKDLTFLAGVLKAPRIRQSWQHLADQARESGWSHGESFAAVLGKEVNAGSHSGAALRRVHSERPARNEQTATLKLASGRYLVDHENVIFLGPPGTGKTHLAIALGVLACHRGDGVLFDTASGWVGGPQQAQ